MAEAIATTISIPPAKKLCELGVEPDTGVSILFIWAMRPASKQWMRPALSSFAKRRLQHSSRIVFDEPDSLHRLRNLAVLHKPAPNVPGPHIVRAQENYACVYTDYVAIKPSGLWIKGIDKSILTIDPATKLSVHRAKNH